MTFWWFVCTVDNKELDDLRRRFAEVVGDMTSQGYTEDEIVTEVQRRAGARLSCMVDMLCLHWALLNPLTLVCFVCAVSYRREMAPEVVGGMVSQGFSDAEIHAALSAPNSSGEVDNYAERA